MHLAIHVSFYVQLLVIFNAQEPSSCQPPVPTVPTVPWKDCAASSTTYCYGARGNNTANCIPNADCDIMVLISPDTANPGTVVHQVYLKNLKRVESRQGYYYLTVSPLNRVDPYPNDTIYVQVKTGSSVFQDVYITVGGRQSPVSNLHGIVGVPANQVIEIDSLNNQTYSKFEYSSQTGVYWPEVATARSYDISLSNPIHVNFFLATDPDDGTPSQVISVVQSPAAMVLAGFTGAGFVEPQTLPQPNSTVSLPPPNGVTTSADVSQGMEPKKFTGLIVGIVIAVLVLGGILAYYLMSTKRKEYDVKTAGDGNKVPIIKAFEEAPEMAAGGFGEGESEVRSVLN